MKHFLYLAFSFLIPLNVWAEEDAQPLTATRTAVVKQFVSCLESEQQNGNGPITSDPNASNGSTRGDRDFYDHYVDYVVSAVEVAGTHQMKLQYYASGAPKVSITVNGVVVIPSLTLPATNSWNIVNREETIDLSLDTGTNVIRIQCLPGYSIRQDKICVTGPSTGQEPACNFDIAPSAEQPIYARRKPMTLYSNCSGGDCSGVTFNWSGNGQTATGGFVTLLSPASGGAYIYTLTASKNGCAAKTDTIVVTVDDALPGCAFAVQPTSTNTTPACSSPVSLSAGCTGPDCNALTYQWTGPGVSQTGQTINITTPANTGSYVYSVTSSKNGCNGQTASLTLNITNCDPPAGGDFNVCLEAENQNGNGPVTSDPNASNGSTRGAENNYNHYVDYAVIGVKTTGTHQVKVRYYASGAAQASIAVNGNVVIPTANFPATNSWNIVWREETFNVILNQGNNVLRIQGLPGNSIRQDKICVTGSGGQQPACAFNIAPASNQPVYDRSKPMTFSANCTGGDCAGVTYTWTGNGINASGTTVNLTSPSTVGTYTYNVTASKAGCADKTSTVTIRVDWGVAPCRFAFYPILQTSNPSCSTPVVISAGCLEYDCDNVSYTWTGPGLNVTGSVVNMTTPPAIGSYVYTVTASKNGCESKTVNYTLNINNCTPPANEDFEVCLESETQDGSAPVTNDPNASGGGTRGVEANYNHYVNYAVNGVPADGVYHLKLRYAASSSPRASIVVNGAYVNYAITIAATNSWNIVFREEVFTIPLKAGNNVVRVEGVSGPSIRQDKICITSINTGNARMAVPENAFKPGEGKEKLNIFPNPAPGEFNASFNMLEDDGKITVADVRGKVWYDAKVSGKGSHHEKIRLSNAPAGIYIMQVKNGKTTDYKKVLLAK